MRTRLYAAPAVKGLNACLPVFDNQLFVVRHVKWQGQLVASELKDPICHSDECQIGSFSSEATNCSLLVFSNSACRQNGGVKKLLKEANFNSAGPGKFSNRVTLVEKIIRCYFIEFIMFKISFLYTIATESFYNSSHKCIKMTTTKVDPRAVRVKIFPLVVDP